MGRSPMLKLSMVAMGGGRKRWGSHLGEAASRRMTRATVARRPRSRPVARPNSPAKVLNSKKALRHGARNLHELHVSADEFALVDLGAPSLGPAPDPRNRHAAPNWAAARLTLSLGLDGCECNDA